MPERSIRFGKGVSSQRGYSLNTTIKILESYTMPSSLCYSSRHALVTKWLTVVTSNSGPPQAYTFHDYIYIIRTAKGKYAKVWLKDYFNETGKGGYITMKYAASDGSVKSE